MADATYALSERMRLVVIAVTMFVILALVNVQIIGKERIVQDGTTILLPLAPVDPRSLLQGDYMVLRYAMSDEVADVAAASNRKDGAIIVALDEKRAAQFVAIHDGQELGDDQHLLQFRKRGETVRLASDAFFFQEGQGEFYGGARFGELRVAADGSAVLIGLRDVNAEPLRTP